MKLWNRLKKILIKKKSLQKKYIKNFQGNKYFNFSELVVENKSLKKQIKTQIIIFFSENEWKYYKDIYNLWKKDSI